MSKMKSRINETVDAEMAGVKNQILETLWNLGDEFFKEIFKEMVVTISSFSNDGGMVINIRSCEDHELENSFSMSEILEKSFEYEDGNWSYGGELPDLETLAQSFEGLARKCRNRLQEIGIKKD